MWLIVSVLCFIQSVLVRSSDEIMVAVKTGDSLGSSGTNNDVYIQINGTKSDIPKRILSMTNFVTYSTRYQMFTEDIGEPYMVTVYKPDNNRWELERITVSAGSNDYVFICNCWINGYVGTFVPNPRPVVSIMTYCQDSGSSIYCTGNDVINIIDAKFGRWDNIICPPIDDSSCKNINVLRILENHCNGMLQCDLKSVQDTYRNISCVSSYTMIVYECITRVMWTITVKTGDAHSYSDIGKKVVIQMQGTKGRTHRIDMIKQFAPGTLECFYIQSEIVEPLKLKVVGNPDAIELKFIVFSDDTRHFIFRCNCTTTDTRQDIELELEMQTSHCNSSGFEYCSNRPTATHTTQAAEQRQTDSTSALSLTTTTTIRQPADTSITPNDVTTTASKGRKTEKTLSSITPTHEPTISAKNDMNVSMTTKDSADIHTFCCTNVTSCHCVCGPLHYDQTRCSLDDVVCVVSALRKQLVVDVKSTSSFKRKKTSAYDSSVSSTLIGATGVIILVSALMVVVIPDGVKLLKHISTIMVNNRNQRNSWDVENK